MPGIGIGISPFLDRRIGIGGWPASEALGVITNNPFDSGDWTVSGTNVWTFAVDGITVLDTGSSLGNVITLDDEFTDLVNEKITIQYVLNSNAGDGLYVGWFPQNTYNPLRFIFGIQPSTGVCFMFAHTGSTSWGLQQSDATAMTMTVGHTYEMVITTNRNVITCSKRNVTTSSTPITQTYTSTFYTSTSGSFSNLGKPAIWSVGSRVKITSYKRESLDLKNVPLLTIGDSITQGYHGGAFATLWSTLIGAQINAGGSETTIEVLKKMPQILQLNPEKVILAIGVNDAFNSVPNWQTNYQDIVTALESNGTTVIVLNLVPGFSGSTAASAWIAATYPTKYIDIRTPLETTPGSGTLNPIYNSGDTHPNTAGNALIASTITASPLY